VTLALLAVALMAGPIQGPPAPTPPEVQATASAVSTDTLTFGAFGTVTLYRAAPHPERVVLFVSGDGGWNLGVVSMARALAEMGALVVGIDMPTYGPALDREAGRCAYPAADLEALSQFVQDRLALPRYVIPVLVGYASGASLVYEALAQAPVNTFKGAVSFGFCADIGSAKAPCSGYGFQATTLAPGRFSLHAVDARPLPWIVLQGSDDGVCSPDSVAAFVARVPGASVVPVVGVGHGFGVAARWLSQLRDAVARLADAPAPDVPAAAPAVEDLPLVEVPPVGPQQDVLAVVLSGDGGWASVDRDVAGVLATAGIPVVGWNSLEYYWTARTPQGAAADLSRILRAYDDRWHRSHFLLVGYSRGADVLPFLADRLPGDLRARVSLIALISLSARVNFQFHLTDLLFSKHRDTDRPVLPELERLRGVPIVCLYGAEEHDSACRALPAGLGEVIVLPGAHHLGGHYEEAGQRILVALGRAER
jgi:type IV secretory pathway VirJ component